jgi:hypothetical protein
LGEAGSSVTVVALPARGRPPQAAARRAGLEFVEKLLTERNGCLAGWNVGMLLAYRLETGRRASQNR